MLLSGAAARREVATTGARRRGLGSPLTSVISPPSRLDGGAGAWPAQATWASACSNHRRSNSAGGRLWAAPWRRLWFHQSTHPPVASSTCSADRQGPRRLISSVL